MRASQSDFYSSRTGAKHNRGVVESINTLFFTSSKALDVCVCAVCTCLFEFDTVVALVEDFNASLYIFVYVQYNT